MVNGSNPSPYSMSAGSSSKAGLEDALFKPGSSSALSSRAEKRKANTFAARRHRQNRLDKIAELESALKAIQLERDAPKVQVAKLEGGTQVLKDIVGGRKVETSWHIGMVSIALYHIDLVQFESNSNSSQTMSVDGDHEPVL